MGGSCADQIVRFAVASAKLRLASRRVFPCGTAAYFFHTCAVRFLWDTAGQIGKTSGNSRKPRRTAGEVDLVLLTHLHPDHIGGLLKVSGRDFSKAQLMMAKPEIVY
ncbi:MAG: MBL fold metallo-hydrolase [Desulfovibrio sp.]|nr:MBL fold metallo-hydrolase [Desulfovibrio sp.]